MVRHPSAVLLAGLAVVGGVGLVIAVQASTAPSPVPPPSVPPSGGGARPPTPLSSPRRAPGARILLVGDSLAQGLTNPMKRFAAQDRQVTFDGHGVPSTRIADWASKPWLAQDLARERPTLVLFSLGTNDMRMPDPTTEQAQLAKIVAMVDAAGAELVWIAPPTMPFPDRGVRAMLAATGRAMYPSQTLAIPRAPDKIHPTMLGYSSWAGAIWTWL